MDPRFDLAPLPGGTLYLVLSARAFLPPYWIFPSLPQRPLYGSPASDDSLGL